MDGRLLVDRQDAGDGSPASGDYDLIARLDLLEIAAQMIA